MIDQIVQSITENICPLSDATIEDFKKVARVTHFKKGELLSKEGDFSDELYYIAKGGARAYYLYDGKTVTDWFAFENDFISSIVSFFLDVPSQHQIEILEDSTLMVLKRSEVDMLCDAHHDFERLGRLSVTKTMMQLQQRVVSIQFKSSRERYESLLEKYPKIEQRAPLGDIASYIGITQETLSRIRNPNSGI